MKYRFLSPAIVELAEAAEFYAGKVPGLGAEFLDEVESAIGRIVHFPKAWAKLGNTHRRCNLRIFPYTVIYSIYEPNEILIVSIFHQSREPNSWQQNL